MFTHVNVLTKEIIGAAIEVHRHLGPGLLSLLTISVLRKSWSYAEFPMNPSGRCR